MVIGNQTKHRPNNFRTFPILGKSILATVDEYVPCNWLKDFEVRYSAQDCVEVMVLPWICV